MKSVKNPSVWSWALLVTCVVAAWFFLASAWNNRTYRRNGVYFLSAISKAKT